MPFFFFFKNWVFKIMCCMPRFQRRMKLICWHITLISDQCVSKTCKRTLCMSWNVGFCCFAYTLLKIAQPLNSNSFVDFIGSNSKESSIWLGSKNILEYKNLFYGLSWLMLCESHILPMEFTYKLKLHQSYNRKQIRL